MLNTKVTLNKYIAALLLCSVSMVSLASNYLNPFDQNSHFWDIQVEGCTINTTLLYAVSLVESAYQNKESQQVSPWPYSFHSPDGSHYANDYQSAIKYLESLIKKYTKEQIDVGIMQINLFWQNDKYHHPADLLNLSNNLIVGCSVLTEAINSSPADLELGIGRYHHWKYPTRSRNYGRRVITIWNNLEAMALN